METMLYKLEFLLQKTLLKSREKIPPYVNVVVVRDENINDPDVKELVNELQSEKVKKFVDEKYQGSIITTF